MNTPIRREARLHPLTPIPSSSLLSLLAAIWTSLSLCIAPVYSAGKPRNRTNGQHQQHAQQQHYHQATCTASVGDHAKLLITTDSLQICLASDNMTGGPITCHVSRDHASPLTNPRSSSYLELILALALIDY